MFDLEQLISKWRKQMLAAGIKTPVPLEELEIHLREEIERQMKSGLSEQEIFNSAVQKIGQPDLLKTEFKKAGGFLRWIVGNKSISVMKRKIGIRATIITLLAAVVLQLAGSPIIARMSITTHQDGHTTVDNFWQIQWYAFVLAGLLFVGIILAILPKRKNPALAKS